MAVGYNAQLEDLTPAELSRLQVKGSGSFEIRDYCESKRIKKIGGYKNESGRKNQESY